MFEILLSRALTWEVILLRLCLAFFLAAIIGYERQHSGQVAGLRTHILICVGAALLMILSIYVPMTYVFGNGAADPGRIAAQVVSGIGFLGAGAILRYGLNVRGITTAANIWVIAAIGLTVGAGLYLPAIFGTFIVLLTLTVVNILEKKLFPKQFLKIIQIESENGLLFKDVELVVKKFGKIKNVNFSRGEEKTSIRIILELRKGSIDSLLHELKNKNISKISISEED